MSARPSLQSERSVTSSHLYESHTKQHSQQSQQQQSQQDGQQHYPHSISSVLSQAPNAGSLLFSPSTLQNLNPLRQTAAAGKRNAASRGTPAATVPLSALPEVHKSDFTGYLEHIQGEYEVWQRQKKAQHSKGDVQASSTSTRPPAQILPDLSAVPRLFMAEDFDLTLPRTFDAVTQLNPAPPSPITSPTAEEAAPVASTSSSSNNERPTLSARQSSSFTHMALGDIASDQMLQEKLSHYLDVVEQHLALEIASRSSTFFSALSNLQSLHAQSQSALSQASDLKHQLAHIDTFSRQGLHALRLALRRHRMQKLQLASAKVKEIAKAVSQARELASSGEWEGALGLVEEVQEAYYATPGQDFDPATEVRLDKLSALKNLPDKLAGLKKQIAGSLQSELLSVLNHLFEAHTREVRDKQKEADQEEVGEMKERAADSARPLVRGLVKCGSNLKGVEDAVAVWRESVLASLRAAIRSHLPASEGVPEEEEAETLAQQTTPTGTGQGDKTKSAALASNLQALSHADFLQLCRDTYQHLRSALSVLKSLTEVIHSLAEEAAVSQQIALNPTDQPLAEDLLDLVYASAELCNTRFSRVMAIRSDIHATSLPFEDFVVLFKDSWAFVLSCEVMCKRMIVGLRGVLVGQSKAWLVDFHRRSVEKSAKLVEDEQWSVVDVPAVAQATVQLIVDGAMADPRQLIIEEGSSNGSSGDQSAGELQKNIDIEGRPFYAVGACLKCMELLLDYLKVIINISLLTTDAMGRIIEFLKQFNSRTCQVVLGAGAMRSAGLKNITAKHLALASQTLSIFINLIPYIRELVRRHLNPRQAVLLIEFDKLKRDFQEHQNEIYAKLVSIMGDRLTVHCKTLQEIDWTSFNQTESHKPNPYMEALVKETTTLHKVLSRYMPGQALELVMMQVLSAITSRLAEEFSKLDLPTLKSKDQLLCDAGLLRQKLSELKGLERTVPGGDLEKLVQDLSTREQPPLPAKPTPPPSPRITTDIAEPSRPSTPPRSNVDMDQESAHSESHFGTGSNVRNRLGALFRSSTLRRSTSSDSQPSISPTRAHLSRSPMVSPRASIDEARPASGEQPARTSIDGAPAPPSAAAAAVSLPAEDSNSGAAAEQKESDAPEEAPRNPTPPPKSAETLAVPNIVEPSGSTDDLALLGTADAKPQSTVDAESLQQEPDGALAGHSGPMTSSQDLHQPDATNSKARLEGAEEVAGLEPSERSRSPGEDQDPEEAHVKSEHQSDTKPESPEGAQNIADQAQQDSKTDQASDEAAEVSAEEPQPGDNSSGPEQQQEVMPGADKSAAKDEATGQESQSQSTESSGGLEQQGSEAENMEDRTQEGDETFHDRTESKDKQNDHVEPSETGPITDETNKSADGS